MLIENKKYSGVTFVELIVVIAIMGIMGSVGFVSLQSSKKDARLKAAQREVAATIKQAQGYALQGKMQNGSAPCGYGFRFTDTSSYEIFYRLPIVGKDCNDVDPSFNSAEEFQLNNGVVLNSPADWAATEIYFAIPFANVSTVGGVNFPSKTLTFKYMTGAGSTKSITISSTGNIVEN